MKSIMLIFRRIFPAVIGISLILAGPLPSRAQGVPIKLDIQSSDVVKIAQLLVEEIHKAWAYIKSSNDQNVREAPANIAKDLNAIAAVKEQITREWSEYKEEIARVGPNTPSDRRYSIDTAFSQKLAMSVEHFSADLKTLRDHISFLAPDWVKKNITTEALIINSSEARGTTAAALNFLQTELVGSSGQVTFEQKVSGAEDLFARQSGEAAALKDLAVRITTTPG